MIRAMFVACTECDSGRYKVVLPEVARCVRCGHEAPKVDFALTALDHDVVLRWKRDNLVAYLPKVDA